VPSTKLLDAVGLLALIGLSLLLRSNELKVSFWIDEGLSVGIGSHPLWDIPKILVQDGSPPLYYMLLHEWMALVSDRVRDVHWFSILFALASIPVAWWAGTSVFDRRVGWLFALLVALCPFLTDYAQEARMYSLVSLLSIAATGFFLNAYLRGRRGFVVPFGLTLAALVYTHNWGLFLGVSMAVGVVILWTALPADDPRRRRVLIDALKQLQHTGAPWSDRPSFHDFLHAPDLILGGFAGTAVLLLAAGAGIVALWRSERFDRRVTIPVLLVMTILPVLIPWLASQSNPAWATRYLAVTLGPLLLLGALGLRRAGWLGAAGTVLIVLMWIGSSAPSWKTNVAEVSGTVSPQLKAGDLVVATQPEMVPVLSYYLHDNIDPHTLTVITPLGPTKDLGITDWRDGVKVFDRTTVNDALLPDIAKLPVGAHVLLVTPIISDKSHWKAPWTKRVADRTIEYEGILRGDPRLQLDAIVPQDQDDPGPNPAQGLLFTKVHD
jgi:mannosyltransferase